MLDKSVIISEHQIRNKIYSIRGVQVMLDRELAELYEVPTKRLNEQVKRNIQRFPKDFMFQLTEIEKNKLVAKCDHLKSLKFSYQNPYVFTEQGVAALSGVLKSKKAIEVNIQIIRAFVTMRKFILSNAQIFQRLDRVEINQLKYEENFEKIFDAIENRDVIKKQGIFFDGQVFDAYKFISDLIKTAKKSIILIDNYIDDSVLTLFSKQKKNIDISIYTKNISNQLKLDLNKYNSQYKPIFIKEFKNSHDRFMIIDSKDIYHLGASLKDLGKKWFAFSKFEKEAVEMLEKLKS